MLAAVALLLATPTAPPVVRVACVDGIAQADGRPLGACAQLRTLRVSGTQAGETIRLDGVTRARFPRLRRVEVNGGGGSDTIHGSAFQDVIRGGDGDDTLFGSGSDSLDGENGSDIYRFRVAPGRSGRATDTGSTGVDHLFVTATSSPDTVVFDASQVRVPSAGAVVAYAGMDRCTTVYLLGGDDEARVEGGHATIFGGAGDDHLAVAGAASAGLDLQGGAGSDRYSVAFGLVEGPVYIFDKGTTGTDRLELACDGVVGEPPPTGVETALVHGAIRVLVSGVDVLPCV